MLVCMAVAVVSVLRGRVCISAESMERKGDSSDCGWQVQLESTSPIMLCG